jgi:ATP-binding cassette subfamily F protein uup
VIAFEGDGRLIENPGGYDDWIAARARMVLDAAPATKAAAAKPATPAPRATGRSTKLSYNETRELERLPDTIAALEAEQADLQQRLLDPEIYRTAPRDAAAWQQRIEVIDTQLLDCLSRWEALEAKQRGEG